MKSAGIIDFHTHAFPDKVAEKAIPALEAEAVVKARSDGKVKSLIASMDRAGVENSVVASIATKPKQFTPIFQWSEAIRSERLIPFPSVHPGDPEALNRIARIAESGFKGIKLHPYYQHFTIDDESVFPLYKRIAEEGLILLLHTGFDIGFPFDRIADPEKAVRILDRFPDLDLVTSHFGAWKDWKESQRLLLGNPVYMDISASFEFMEEETAGRFLHEHPKEYLLFGSDTPWDDQGELLDRLYRFNLPADRLNALLSENARRLLGL